MTVRSAAESLPLRIDVECPECGRTVTTTQSGNTTRCPADDGGCGTPIPIPAGLTRPAVRLACGQCGHVWSTRAAGGGTVRCPSCRHNRRVPVSIRDEADRPYTAPRPRRAPERRPAAPRRAPAPEPESASLSAILGGFLGNRAPAPAPRPASQARPAPKTPKPSGRPIQCRSCGHNWTTRAQPDNTVRCPECEYAQRVPMPSTPRPSYSPQQAAAQSGDRLDQAAMLVMSFGGPLRVRYDATPGACEVWDMRDTREAQRCQRTVTRAVVFDTRSVGGAQLHVYACALHADPLAQQARHAFHVTTEVRALERTARPAESTRTARATPPPPIRTGHMRSAVDAVLRSLGGPFYLRYEAMPWDCWILDTRQQQVCARPADRRIAFQLNNGNVESAHACAAHGEAVVQLARQAAHVRAELYRYQG